MKITKRGTNIVIQSSVKFNGGGEVIIYGGVEIGHEAWIETHTHDFHSPEKWQNKPEIVGMLTIESNVYVGARAMVLFGCKKIAEGVVIGAGSIVTRFIDEHYTIWAGNPAKKIGERK